MIGGRLKNAENDIPLDGGAYESMVNEYNQVELDRFFNKGVTEQRYVKENIMAGAIKNGENYE